MFMPHTGVIYQWECKKTSDAPKDDDYDRTKTGRFMRIVAQYVPLLLTQRLTLDADEYQRRACEVTHEILGQIESVGFLRVDLDLPDPRNE